jgi:hypothetical protein
MQNAKCRIMKSSHFDILHSALDIRYSQLWGLASNRSLHSPVEPMAKQLRFRYRPRQQKACKESCFHPSPAAPQAHAASRENIIPGSDGLFQIPVMLKRRQLRRQLRLAGRASSFELPLSGRFARLGLQ